MRLVVSSCIGIVLGILIGYYFLFVSPQPLIRFKNTLFPQTNTAAIPQKEIIGFLPYWLIAQAQEDYTPYITTLTYFGLTVGTDGKIQYLANEQEEEPGYHMLKSQKLSKMLKTAKDNGVKTSLLVFSGDADAIDLLISKPSVHAKHLVSDVTPIMKKYGFTDLNLDIESTRLSSDAARQNFTQFVKTVKEEVEKQKLGTVTVEITGQDLIRKTLIDPKAVAKIADYIVIMAYDFHYQGSQVSGAVAPLGGSEQEAEFDTKIVLSQAYKMIPKDKIILGIPSYGYSWETLTSTPKNATLPGSGITTSNKRAEKWITECTSCTVGVDTLAQEAYVITKDEETGTYHQLFYPDKNSTQQKVNVAKKENLAGLAVWALGYEALAMYQPLAQYKKDTFDITRL